MKKYNPNERLTPAEKKRRKMLTPVRASQPRGECRYIPLRGKVNHDEIRALLDRLYGDNK